jgi:heme oxygenase
LSARAYLRAITRDAHDRVDAGFSAFDLTSIEFYADFLVAQAAAFLPVEAALDRAGAAELLPDWQQRRRSDALKSDIAALGRSLPDPIQPPFYADAAAVWGGLYVLEGSRLGGAMLNKVAGPAFPRSFLAPPAEKGLWRQFVVAVERNLYDRVGLERAGQSAIHTFACFEKSVARA